MVLQEFYDLELNKLILNALREQKYLTPTPIQKKCIPLINGGADLLGISQTGTGKTAAFALPLLNRLAQKERRPSRLHTLALILVPTRELACQIDVCLKAYGRHLQLRSLAVYGGASIRPQIQKLRNGIDVLVATPGRLMDLMRQGCVKLGQVEILVLDEADRMLDMGFINDVRKISEAISKQRQTVMFSATMPKSVHSLAKNLLTNPVTVEASPSSKTLERLDHRVQFLPKNKKQAMIGELLNDKKLEKILIFTRTKHCADRVVKYLHNIGVSTDVIHGNKTQGARQKALKKFRTCAIRALVATDIAARGIDVDGITHIINYELPNDPENYVHRVGRTARAGAEGAAISFCDHEERGYLREIEKVIGQTIPVDKEHPYHAAEIVNLSGSNKKNGRPNKKISKKSTRQFKRKSKAGLSNKQRHRREAA